MLSTSQTRENATVDVLYTAAECSASDILNPGQINEPCSQNFWLSGNNAQSGGYHTIARFTLTRNDTLTTFGFGSEVGKCNAPGQILWTKYTDIAVLVSETQALAEGLNLADEYVF